MTQEQLVREHYTFEGMADRIEAALSQIGLDKEAIHWSDLVQLDQFHSRGLVATQEMAQGLDLTGGETILDIGSGLGGPARYLAAVHGSHVTGIELTPLYVDIAQRLSEKTGLSEKLSFIQGDALNLPFPDAHFDHVWTQHVAMNIEDKGALYQGIFRVLKPGGRFALYDIMLGDNHPVLYPTPWAKTIETSFVVSEDEVSQRLKSAGFKIISLLDTTQQAFAFMAEVKSQVQEETLSPLTLPAIIGSQSKEAMGNVARNLLEGRIRVVQIIAEKNV